MRQFVLSIFHMKQFFTHPILEQRLKKCAVENTQAINQAILAASKQGGATVVIAKGRVSYLYY